MEVTSENRNRVSKGIEAGSSIIGHSNVHGQETQSQVARGEPEKGDGFLMTMPGT